MIDTKELRRLLEEDGKNNIDLDEIHELIDRLEAAEKSDAESIALYRKARDERDALRTVLADLLNDLEERAKWNLEESQRVVACGNGVYMRAKAALEETK